MLNIQKWINIYPIDKFTIIINGHEYTPSLARYGSTWHDCIQHTDTQKGQNLYYNKIEDFIHDAIKKNQTLLQKVSRCSSLAQYIHDLSQEKDIFLKLDPLEQSYYTLKRTLPLGEQYIPPFQIENLEPDTQQDGQIARPPSPNNHATTKRSSSSSKIHRS